MRKLKAVDMTKVSRAVGKFGLKIKKRTPEILVVGGVVGLVGSGVMACKATTKASAIIEQTKEELAKIEVCSTDPQFAEEYTEEDKKKDTLTVYASAGMELCKVYGPSLILGALSITAIFTSNNMLRKRNMALASAYAVVDKGYKTYRQRVIERFGEEVDRELKYNIKNKEFEKITVNEKGEEVVTIETVPVVDDPNEYSEFARFFDDGCKGWSKDPEHNLAFLIAQQNFANEKLKRRGYLFLNEVYDMLGIRHTAVGQMVGWFYDEECPTGDNFVSFGIHDSHRQAARDFVNGYERVILLDFNVDGNILEYL